MLLNHVGIANTSRDDAVRFYRDFLGLGLIREAVIAAELTAQIFNVPEDMSMLVFEGQGIKLEVFIHAGSAVPPSGVHHFGLYIDDLAALLEKAAASGVEVIKGTAKDKTVYFLRDFSGNLVEIKQN